MLLAVGVYRTYTDASLPNIAAGDRTAFFGMRAEEFDRYRIVSLWGLNHGLAQSCTGWFQRDGLKLSASTGLRSTFRRYVELRSPPIARM